MVHPGQLRERLTLQTHMLSEDRKTGAITRRWKKIATTWGCITFLKPSHRTTKPQTRSIHVIIRNQMFLSGISSIWWRHKRFILTATPMLDETGQWASFMAVEDQQ